jgi:hypothetical protein
MEATKTVTLTLTAWEAEALRRMAFDSSSYWFGILSEAFNDPASTRDREAIERLWRQSGAMAQRLGELIG